MYLLLLPLLVIVYQESLMVHGLKYMPPSNSLTRLVTPQTKPILYVYDHCPFCVRVRLAFGLKNIKHEVRFLANDDVDTPTKLIGSFLLHYLNLIEKVPFIYIYFVSRKERCSYLTIWL